MKTIKHLYFAALVCGVLIGCRGKDVSNDESFDFRVSAESVVEGEAIPVTLTLVSGPTGSYQLNDYIYALDIKTDSRIVSPYHLYFGRIPAGGERYSFAGSQKMDFNIPGADAGTYYIEVILEREGQRKEASAVVVVKKAGGDGPDTPPTPPVEEKIPVESLSLLGLNFVDGIIEIEPGEEVFGTLHWAPANATETDFIISSSNEDSVEASLDGDVISLKGISVGRSVVTVYIEDGVSLRFTVDVKSAAPPVEALSIEGLDLAGGRLDSEAGDERRYELSWSPSGAVPVFSVSSSNPDVVNVFVEGMSTLVVKSLYPGDAVVSVSTGDGVSTTFPVRVVKTVNIVVEWEELQATDAQLRTKTFPCQLKISSDSDIEFPSPVRWTLTLNGIVNVSGKDTQSKTVKSELSFVGNRVFYYDVSTHFLVECYLIYRTENFDLSVAMALQLNNPLNSDYWKLNINEKFKTQDAKINQYITSFQ